MSTWNGRHWQRTNTVRTKLNIVFQLKWVNELIEFALGINIFNKFDSPRVSPNSSHFIPTKPSNGKPAFRCTNEKIQNAYSWNGIDNHGAWMTKIHWTSCKRMHKAVGETVTENKMHRAKPDCHQIFKRIYLLTARCLYSLRQPVHIFCYNS